MSKIDEIPVGKLALHREPVAKVVERRNPEFAQRLESAVFEVNNNQHVADASAEAVIQGKLGIHEGMLALSRASTSLKLLAQVRNKALSAYNEVMRMQV